MSVQCMEIELSSISPIGCGQTVRSYFPESTDDLRQIGKILAEEEYVLCGKLTNMLFLPSFQGVTVFTDAMKGVSLNGGKIKARAGERISKLCGVAQYAGLSGMENFFGLPGTVGGAISGNAGCFGSEIADILESVTVFKTDEGEFEELSKEEIAFSYRYCNLRKNKDLIVDATFSLMPERKDRIAERMAAVRRERTLKQPRGRTLGSYFKQYFGVSAGYYIEKSGLKGYEEGGVRVSETHANFFINETGDAMDYYRIGEVVKRKVREKFGIGLEREVIVIGEERSGDRNGRTLFD